MPPRLLHALLASLLLATLLSSCSVGTDPGPCEQPECFPLAAVMTMRYGVDLSVDGIATMTFASAFFRVGVTPRTNGRAVAAGDVFFNGIELRRFDTSGGSRYERSDTMLPFFLPPRWNVWRVTGSGSIPAIVDSIEADTGAIILSPLPGDTLSSTNGLVVRWQPARRGGAGGAVSVLVYRQHAGVLQRSVLDSIGELRFPPSEVQESGIVPGEVMIVVRREVTVDRLVAPAYHYRMVIDHEEAVHVYFGS